MAIPPNPYNSPTLPQEIRVNIELSKADTEYLITTLDAFVKAQGLNEAARSFDVARRMQGQVQAIEAGTTPDESVTALKGRIAELEGMMAIQETEIAHFEENHEDEIIELEGEVRVLREALEERPRNEVSAP